MSHSRRKAEEEHEEGPSAERWLLTYADMITLLMVLFIVLFAMGQTDIRKFNAFKDSFHTLTATQQALSPQGGPGILSQPSAIAVILTNPFARLEVARANSDGGQKSSGHQASGQKPKGQANSGKSTKGQSSSGRSANGATAAGTNPNGQKASHLTPAQERAQLEKAARALEQALKAKGLSEDVTINLSRDGLIVSILTDKVLFPLDSAVLQSEGVAVIDAIAPVLATLPNQVEVEGDTDNIPINGGPYLDNWALSAARAVAVVEDLIYHHGIAAYRLQATGFGDTRPLVPNDTAQHRAQNRRVELVVLSTTVTAP